jgi:RNA polymerase sigma-70 factor (ECF subfamily)
VTSQTEQQDQNWIARINGDKPTQAQALEELRIYLLRGLSKVLGNKGLDSAMLDDVVQDSILKVLRKQDQFAGRSRFTTWAMSIAIRQGLSVLRRRENKGFSLDQGLESEAGGYTGKSIDIADHRHVPPEDLADKQKLLGELQRLINDTLSDKQRLVIQEGLKGKPLEELADEIGSNRNALYKMMHDARVKLKSGLEQAGYSLQDIQILIT